MELCLAKFWSTLGNDTSFTVRLHFRGVSPSPSALHIGAGQRVSEEVRVRADLCVTEVAPAAKLENWISVLKPGNFQIVIF